MNTHSLDQIIISASRFAQDIKEIPQKILQINKQGITISNPQTSADLLNMSGHVYIQKSQLGGGSPIIRGVSTNRLVLSVDGVRLNNAIYRACLQIFNSMLSFSSVICSITPMASTIPLNITGFLIFD